MSCCKTISGSFCIYQATMKLLILCFCLLFLLVHQAHGQGQTTIPIMPGGCKAFEFRCNDGQCIDLYLRCDGDRDCADGSDEDLCGTSCNQPYENLHCPRKWINFGESMKCFCKENCREIELRCLNNGRLQTTESEYSHHWLDCRRDYKDEDYTLNSGEKIHIAFIYDKLKIRCRDSFTFEAGKAKCDATGISVTRYPVCVQGPPIPVVPGGCKAFEFRCNDGQCIDLYLRCDGDRDCADGSDEDKCGKKQLMAFPESFRCRSNASSSHLYHRCNSDINCVDNSDEAGCPPGVCGVARYRCENGKCIDGRYVCNDFNNCDDNSDEIYCSRFAARGGCSAWKIHCGNNMCVNGAFGCNAEGCKNRNTNSTRPQICKRRGRDECGDNSDENNCNILSACPSNEFLCDNGMCVPLSAKCDGKNHCGDGSDEWICPKPTGGCKQCEFSCIRTGQCVPWNARCDGLFHCTDGSDEWADACDANVPDGCSDLPACLSPPPGLNCGAVEYVQINESRICTCLNTCRRVKITCLTNGSWSRTKEQCSRPLQKCSNTVVSCFKNGKYKFKCANGYKQISGNSTAICENGQLKFSEKLKCEKIRKDDFTSTWTIMGTSLSLLAILHVAIAVYCYRKDNQMFAAWENVPVSEPTASTSGTVELRRHPI